MRQEINLYAPIFRTPRERFAAASILRITALALGVMALLYAYSAWQLAALRHSARAEQARHDALAARLAEQEVGLAGRATDAGLATRIRTLTAERNAKTRALARIARGGVAADEGADGRFIACFEGLARQRLEGLWLTAIRIGDHGEALTLEGRALGGELLPRYLTRLAQEPSFKNREFRRLEMQRSPAMQGNEPARLDFVLSTTAAAQ